MEIVRRPYTKEQKEESSVSPYPEGSLKLGKEYNISLGLINRHGKGNTSRNSIVIIIRK